jgi:PAS domain S-box-containing protein
MQEQIDYRNLFDTMLGAFNSLGEAFSIFQIIRNENGQAVDYRYLEISSSIEKAFGKTRAEILGNTRRELFGVNVDPTDVLLTRFDEIDRTGLPAKFETCSPANRHSFEIYAWKVGNKLAMMYSDVTERKKAEEALKESENKYRLILEATNEGIWVAPPDGKATFVNQKMADMLGYSKEEILGHVGLEFLDKSQEAPVIQNRELLKNNKPVQVECKFIRKDGSTLWTMANTAPIIDSQGKHVGNIAMHTDITDRKKAEEALEKAAREKEFDRKRLETTLETSPSAIVVIEALDGKFSFVNKRALELYGVDFKGVDLATNVEKVKASSPTEQHTR